jgi:putative FmdB family regulatory protein
MAIYQYACMECDKDYEKERPITDPEPQYFCEKCGYALSRVYSAVGAVFKGGGFYVNDSRR